MRAPEDRGSCDENAAHLFPPRSLRSVTFMPIPSGEDGGQQRGSTWQILGKY